MIAGLFRHYAHVAWRSPICAAALIAAAVSGALSTLYPVGARTPGSAPGLLGGVGLGLRAAVIILPFVITLLLLATAGADEDLELVREFHLAGVPSPTRWRAALAATVVVGVGTVWPAVATGSLAGLGDAVRTSSPLLGTLNADPLPIALAVCAGIYFVLIGLGVLVVSRSSVYVGLGLPMFLALFLALLRVFAFDAPIRWVLRLTPFGPVWSTLLPEGRQAVVLVTPVPARIAVAVGWMVFVVAAMRWRVWREAGGR